MGALAVDALDEHVLGHDEYIRCSVHRWRNNVPQHTDNLRGQSFDGGGNLLPDFLEGLGKKMTCLFLARVPKELVARI